MYKIAFRIMACPERKEMVDAELKKLEGFDVKAFYDDRPKETRKGTSYTQLACINDVLGKDYTHICLLQDDLLLVNDFGKCIYRLVEKRPLALWTPFCPRIKAEDLSFSSPYARIFPANTWGQCNIIPLNMLEKIMEFREEKLSNYIYDDAIYLLYCKMHGMPVYTTRIALMQHLCPTSSMLGYNNKNKVSKLWAGEDVYSKINWNSDEYKKYRLPDSVNEEEVYAKYG